MENENKEEISINDPDLNLLCIFSFDVILSFFDKKEFEYLKIYNLKIEFTF